MTTRRSILSAALAGMATVGGGVALAAARPDDDALRGLIADWRAARDAYRIARDRRDDATRRAEERYPGELSKWWKWREMNHPGGVYTHPPLVEATSPRMQPLRAELEALPRDEKGYRVLPKGSDFMARVADAWAAEEEDYYSPLRPTYDQLIADRNADIAAINAEEGLSARAAERDAAFERACEAFDALAAHRPATAEGALRKAAALLRSPFVSGQFDDDAGETAAILADAEALIGGAA